MESYFKPISCLSYCYKQIECIPDWKRTDELLILTYVDNVLKLSNFSGTEQVFFQGHQEEITSIDVSRDNRRMLSFDKSRLILWNVDDPSSGYIVPIVNETTIILCAKFFQSTTDQFAILCYDQNRDDQISLSVYQTDESLNARQICAPFTLLRSKLFDTEDGNDTNFGCDRRGISLAIGTTESMYCIYSEHKLVCCQENPFSCEMTLSFNTKSILAVNIFTSINVQKKSKTVAMVVFSDGWLYEVNLHRNQSLEHIMKRCSDEMIDFVDIYVDEHVKLNDGNIGCAVFISDKIIISDSVNFDIYVYNSLYVVQNKFCSGCKEIITSISFPDKDFPNFAQMPRAVALAGSHILMFSGGKINQKISSRRSLPKHVDFVEFHPYSPLVYLASKNGTLSLADISKYCIRMELPFIPNEDAHTELQICCLKASRDILAVGTCGLWSGVHILEPNTLLIICSIRVPESSIIELVFINSCAQIAMLSNSICYLVGYSIDKYSILAELDFYSMHPYCPVSIDVYGATLCLQEGHLAKISYSNYETKCENIGIMCRGEIISAAPYLERFVAIISSLGIVKLIDVISNGVVCVTAVNPSIKLIKVSDNCQIFGILDNLLASFNAMAINLDKNCLCIHDSH